MTSSTPSMPGGSGRWQTLLRPIRRLGRWLFDDRLDLQGNQRADGDRLDLVRCLPFLAIHVGCLAALWVGVSPVAVAVAALLFVARMFFVTAFYHRYFSHRTFRTSRPMQFLMGALASSSGQRGPLWWAAHHRHHHNHSDEQPDLHSPNVVGFFRSHMGWFMTSNAFATQEQYVRDWLRYPELRWLNRLDWAPVLLLALGCWMLGAALQRWAPGLGTSGGQMFTWGFLISTVALYHCTYTINSFAHRFGTRRYNTGDDSRNNLLLAVLTLGEGWHNNHHHYPAAARQGFYWWEFDPTYYALLLMQKVGLIWDVRPVPRHVLERNRVESDARAKAS